MARGPGRPPKEASDRARAQILEAATELFSEQGFAATPVSLICQRAGVAKPALYWHFDSKEGLLEAVLEEGGARWIEDLQKRTASRPDGGDQLTDLVAEWRRIILEQPEQLLLPLVAQLEQGAASERAKEAVLRVRRRAEQMLVDGIAQATPGLELPDLDLVAFVAVTLLQGAMLRYNESRDEAALDRALAEVRRTLSLLIWDRLPPDLRRAAVDTTGGAASKQTPK